MDTYSQFAALLTERTSGFASLSPGQMQALHQHYELMLRWNPKLNLTSVTELEEAVAKHYAESLFLASLVPKHLKTLMDIGAGAGFPGYPAAVALPGVRLILVESDQRKAAFLREASDFAPNMRVLAVRSETLMDPVEGVIARAVRPEDVLRVAKRVASWFGILVSRADGEKLAHKTGAHVIGLPWDESAVALVGDLPVRTS
jgi:16S rRNA (guanine(527)-N(7))-methyltransferase RsmG